MYPLGGDNEGGCRQKNDGGRPIKVRVFGKRAVVEIRWADRRS
jgi:hypothetical protein